MSAAVGAVLLSAAAGALLPGGRPGLQRLRPRCGPVLPAGRLTAVLGVVALGAVVGALPALVLVGVAALVRGAVARRVGRRTAAERRDRLGELLAALCAELQTGAAPRPALAAAAGGLRGLESLAAAAAGPVGDVGAELARIGTEPGGRAALDLAAAWRLADETGCGLAEPARRVLVVARAEERLRRELAAQLAGPTATARLLAALPAAGVGMGVALGADPLGFLLGPGSGRACLAAGLALLLLGWRWTRSLTAAAASTWTADGGAGP